MAHAWPPGGTGGVERYAHALATAQGRLGARVARFGPGDVVAPPGRGFGASWAWRGAEEAFGAAMGRLRPDVVHVHHLTGLSLAIPRMAAERGARVVFTLHDAWLRCARGQLVNLQGERCAGPEPRRCATCLAPALWGPLPGVGRLPPRVGPVRAREAAVEDLRRHVDLWLSPSRHLPARLGLPAEHLPLPLLEPATPAAPRPPGPVAFLFVGAVIPTKGPHLALDAYARLPAGAATLTMVGPSPPYAGSTRYAEELRRRALPGVTWRGALPAEEIPWGEHDVLLFPSTWIENSPLVLQEASARGLRIIASDVPGARALVPQARFVEDWRDALAPEIARGQARVPPATWPDLGTHAEALLVRYATLCGGTPDAPTRAPG